MLKMTIKKKINPQKSNKLIYAVAAGLADRADRFFRLTFGSGGGNKLPADILAYLKNTEGLIEVRVDRRRKNSADHF